MTDASARIDAGPPPSDEFDAAALDRLIRFGGRKLLTSMVEMFMVQAPLRLLAGREAVDLMDAPGAKLAFHSLKSSAAQLGAAHLGRLCGEAEEMARTDRLEALAALLPELDAAYDRAARWMADRQQAAEAAG